MVLTLAKVKTSPAKPFFLTFMVLIVKLFRRPQVASLIANVVLRGVCMPSLEKKNKQKKKKHEEKIGK